MPQKPGRKDEEKVLTPEETAEYFKNFAIEQGGVVLDNEGNLLEGDPAKVGLPPHAN